jgi:predicted transcriptional regulator of viral defense system/very-short-patch-repair endonuclease
LFTLGRVPDQFAVDPAIAGKVQTHPIDQVVAELAEQQHGVVARVQLLRLGLSASAIDHRCDRGTLHRLQRGVYAVGHRVQGRAAEWMAAVLGSGPGSVLSHYSAAELWRLRPISGRTIELTTPGSARSRSGTRRHVARIPDDEVTTERGIAVTTVPRTLFDLASIASADVVESALREAEYRRLYDRLSLPDLLARYPQRRGALVIRQRLARRAEAPVGLVKSPLEERFLPFLRRYRLPPPQLNAWIPLGPASYEVDCLWPATKTIVELDGYEGHGTRGAFREDRARDRRLRVAGYGVTRIVWAQLDDEPDEIAADLRLLLDGEGPRRYYKRP